MRFYFRYAKEFDEENLASRCWEMIKKKTLDCIHSEGMLAVDRDILKTLIKRDSLNVQEVELFKAAKRYPCKPFTLFDNRSASTNQICFAKPRGAWPLFLMLLARQIAAAHGKVHMSLRDCPDFT